MKENKNPKIHGPFKILEKVGNNAYKLSLPPYMHIFSIENIEKLTLYDPPKLATTLSPSL
jgi:hypothetical protein